MTTLANALPKSNSIAVIKPGPTPVHLSYLQLNAKCNDFRKQLSALGIRPGRAVSIAIPNSIEFIVCIFLVILLNLWFSLAEADS
jgi:non-ribosomal peptide synthetase component E (peptide arylation enzyme)